MYELQTFTVPTLTVLVTAVPFSASAGDGANQAFGLESMIQVGNVGARTSHPYIAAGNCISIDLIDALISHPVTQYRPSTKQQH